MTIDTRTLLGDDTSLTETDVARAVKQLVYRKLYAKRPEVVEARRRYNRKRQETIKLAMEVYRRSKEAV